MLCVELCLNDVYMPLQAQDDATRQVVAAKEDAALETRRAIAAAKAARDEMLAEARRTASTAVTDAQHALVEAQRMTEVRLAEARSEADNRVHEQKRLADTELAAAQKVAELRVVSVEKEAELRLTQAVSKLRAEEQVAMAGKLKAEQQVWETQLAKLRQDHVAGLEKMESITHQRKKESHSLPPLVVIGLYNDAGAALAQESCQRWLNQRQRTHGRKLPSRAPS